MGKHDFRKISDRTERAAVRMLKSMRFHVLSRRYASKHVFVAGMQRSGTNMVMGILDRSFLTDVYHETDPRAFRNYQMRSREVIHELDRRTGAPFFVIKSLCELEQLRSLMDEFYPAKALWIVRDFNDAVNSAVASFDNFAPRMNRMCKDRLSDGWFGRGMSDETHELLREFYHPDISETSAAAAMWYYRNVLFFEQGLDKDPRVMLLKYETLVSQPRKAFPRIFKFLGIPYSRWATRHVFASSIRRRAPPVIDAPILERCQELSQKFDAVLRAQLAREAA